MAHKLGSMHHVTHGTANGMLLCEVIRFNAADNPRKQAAFPQYKYPNAKWRYAKIAEFLGLNGKTEDEQVELLIEKIEELKRVIHVPSSIREYGVDEKAFYASLDEMSEQAFDDQCTPANPRYPLISEIKQMYIKAYEGNGKKTKKK